MKDPVSVTRDRLEATVVVVTHELQSIFALGDHAIFLDAQTRTMRTQGNPRELLEHSHDPHVREFLTRRTQPRPPAQPASP